MADCNCCGEPVIAGTAFHPGCLMDKIRKTKQEMCDRFCIWARIYQDDDRLMAHHCMECPFIGLMALAPSKEGRV